MTIFRSLALLSGIALSIGFVVGLAAPAHAQDPVLLRVHHFLPPQAPIQTRFLDPWSKKLMADSGNKLKVEIYPAMQLGGRPPQLYDQAKDGVVDIVWTLPGYTPGRFPISEVFELPFIMTTAEATAQAMQEFYAKHLKQEFAEVHPLAFHAHAPGLIHSRGKEVTKLEDLKGLKLRAPTRRVGQMLELLGATQIGMPVPQVPEALSKGVIDGAVVPYEVIIPLRVFEMAKYHTEFIGSNGLYTAFFILAMNKQKYENLPADLKKVIDDNSGMVASRQLGKAFDQVDEEGREIVKKAGNKVINIQGAELERWKKAAAPVTDSWIEEVSKKGVDGKALHAEALALIQKYSSNR